MAYDVTNFSDFISRENDILTASLFAGGDTAKFAMYMTGVKGSTSVPHIGGAANLQAGSCATPSGDASISEVIMTVKPFTVFESWCNDDLQTKFPNSILAPGSSNADAPNGWEAKIVEVKVASIAEALENHYWKGDTSGTYNLFDGFIKIIDADGGAIDGNTSNATAINTSNVKGLVDDMYVSAPAKVKRDGSFVILVGDDVFDMYIAAEKADNLYHYAPEHDNGSYKIGGSRGSLQRVYGLDRTDRMFASAGGNFIVGSDVENESAVANVFYDETLDKVMMRVKAKAGVQIQNSEEIVEFTIA